MFAFHCLGSSLTLTLSPPARTGRRFPSGHTVHAVYIYIFSNFHCQRNCLLRTEGTSKNPESFLRPIAGISCEFFETRVGMVSPARQKYKIYIKIRLGGRRHAFRYGYYECP